MDASSIEWQWNDNVDNEHARAGDADFSAAFDPQEKQFVLQCMGSDDEAGWTREIPATGENAAALAAGDDAVYVAIYAKGATGCQVLAFDASAGQDRWQVVLEGLGSVGHSRYFNQVQLKFDQDRLIVFGHEASGRYIEVLDPASGQQVALRREP